MSDPKPYASIMIRVLHVDDEEDQLMLGKRFLEKADPSLQVVYSTSPEEAISMLQEQSFDCVVSDYQMPNMNGIELAQKLRETSNIPFIIYTGRGSQEVAENAFAVGVDDYLRKEFDPSHYYVLAKRIKTAVEKHKAEKMLKESEEKFRGIAERAIDTIFMVDLEGQLTYISPSAERIIGYRAEEVKGKHFQNFLPEHEIPKAVEKFVETLGSTGMKGLQVELFRRDGSQVFVEINASPVIKDGEVIGIQGNIRDITERKRYEEQLEALYSHAAELGKTNTLGEVTERTFNAIERVLGFDKGSFSVVEGGFLREILSKGVEMEEVFELPLDGPGITVRAVRTGETQLVSDTRLDKDFVLGPAEGVYEPLSELVVPIMVTGKVVAVINVESSKLGAFTDEDQRLLEIFSEHVASAISRLMHAEKLKASEERWRTLLEASMDAVTVNVGTKLVYANKRLADLLGYSSPSELIGKDITEIDAPEYRETIRARTLRRQRGEEEPERYEFKLLRRDGTSIDVETHTTFIEYEGKPAALSFVRDITERKRMEDDLRESRERVREKEAGRTATLIRGVKIAEEEIRNPLLLIQQSTHVADENGELNKEIINIIQANIEKIKVILNKLREEEAIQTLFLSLAQATDDVHLSRARE